MVTESPPGMLLYLSGMCWATKSVGEPIPFVEGLPSFAHFMASVIFDPLLKKDGQSVRSHIKLLLRWANLESYPVTVLYQWLRCNNFNLMPPLVCMTQLYANWKKERNRSTFFCLSTNYTTAPWGLLPTRTLTGSSISEATWTILR